jgi:hypothetical protein
MAACGGVPPWRLAAVAGARRWPARGGGRRAAVAGAAILGGGNQWHGLLHAGVLSQGDNRLLLARHS